MAELNQNSGNAGGRKRTRPLGARVDLTAMVDLAFLLVTFFILTTRLQKPQAMDLAMPDKTVDGGVAVAESRTLTLCLGAGNKVVWYRGLVNKPLNGPLVTSFTANGLRRTVQEVMQQIKQETGKDMIVVVKPAETSNYGNLVSTLDELNIAGANRYAVTDIAKEDVDLLKARKVW